jgi:hypothetical protein
MGRMKIICGPVERVGTLNKEAHRFFKILGLHDMGPDPDPDPSINKKKKNF